jgi:hypothetical protein
VSAAVLVEDVVQSFAREDFFAGIHQGFRGAPWPHGAKQFRVPRGLR